MKEKTIYIQTEKELRTYMHPLRQQILFELSLRPQGMTAKQLADALGIAPSSAGHHLGKLDPGLAYYFESKISEITVKIGNRKIPVVMNMEQQTEFALGYYQQRAVLYAPKEK